MNENTPTALITGGSRGIGKACVKALAQKGFQVLLTYVSKESEAQSVVDEVAAQGGNARAYCLDVSDSSAVTTFFQKEIVGKFHLDVLVNNAGITKDGLLIRMKDDDFDRVVAVNLRGAFICTREASKIMIKQRYGRIVSISSVVGQAGNAGQVNYAASKAGIIGLTMSAAKELASRGITVNAVAPGYIDTDMTASLSEEARTALCASIPLKRTGTPEDVASAVAFLASPEAGYITGQVLAVNGGLYC